MATSFIATQSSSERAIAAPDLADLVARVAPEHPVQTFESLEFAVQDARVWAAQAPRRAVLVTGSITLIGEVIGLASAEGWK